MHPKNIYRYAPVFSIIIPTYNAISCIERAVDSIMNQTCNSYEVIIMDGGSTDNTVEILQCRANEKLRIYSGKDDGIYDAMNKGIKLSTGKWLYFLGADDRLNDPFVLEKINECMKADADLIYGNVVSDQYPGVVYNGEFTDEKLYVMNICHQSIFASRKIFQKVGIFNTQYKYNADWEHNIKWFFQPDIKKMYVNVNICNYAATGESAIRPDKLFLKNKISIFLKYGKASCSRSFKKKIYRELIHQQKNEAKFIQARITRIKLFFI